MTSVLRQGVSLITRRWCHTEFIANTCDCHRLLVEVCVSFPVKLSVKWHHAHSNKVRFCWCLLMIADSNKLITVLILYSLDKVSPTKIPAAVWQTPNTHILTASLLWEGLIESLGAAIGKNEAWYWGDGGGGREMSWLLPYSLASCNSFRQHIFNVHRLPANQCLCIAHGGVGFCSYVCRREPTPKMLLLTNVKWQCIHADQL